MIEINEEKAPTFTSNEAIDHIKKYLNRISERYTKSYNEDLNTDEHYMYN
jgi:hypothetical protein